MKLYSILPIVFVWMISFLIGILPIWLSGFPYASTSVGLFLSLQVSYFCCYVSLFPQMNEAFQFPSAKFGSLGAVFHIGLNQTLIKLCCFKLIFLNWLQFIELNLSQSEIKSDDGSIGRVLRLGIEKLTIPGLITELDRRCGVLRKDTLHLVAVKVKQLLLVVVAWLGKRLANKAQKYLLALVWLDRCKMICLFIFINEGNKIYFYVAVL